MRFIKYEFSHLWAAHILHRSGVGTSERPSPLPLAPFALAARGRPLPGGDSAGEPIPLAGRAHEENTSV